MNCVLNFLRDQRGSETVQFVVWLPLIAFVLITVTDASFLYLNHTEMTNVARDTARRLTTGNLLTEDEAKAYAYGELAQYAYNYEVLVNRDPDAAMTVVVSVPVVDVTVFGFFLTPVLGSTMGTRVVMRSDPTVAALFPPGGGGGNGGGGGGLGGGVGGNGGGNGKPPKN